jgi:hypothetical protein
LIQRKPARPGRAFYGWVNREREHSQPQSARLNIPPDISGLSSAPRSHLGRSVAWLDPDHFPPTRFDAT